MFPIMSLQRMYFRRTFGEKFWYAWHCKRNAPETVAPEGYFVDNMPHARESQPRTPGAASWRVRDDASFVHVCANETIHGLEFHSDPDLDECTCVQYCYQLLLLLLITTTTTTNTTILIIMILLIIILRIKIPTLILLMILRTTTTMDTNHFLNHLLPVLL